jgi:hypothetical protein
MVRMEWRGRRVDVLERLRVVSGDVLLERMS